MCHYQPRQRDLSQSGESNGSLGVPPCPPLLPSLSCSKASITRRGQTLQGLPFTPDFRWKLSSRFDTFKDRCSNNKLPMPTRNSLQLLLPDCRRAVCKTCLRVHDTDTHFTDNELKQVLHKKDTALGATSITYSLLHHVGRHFHQALLSLFNKSYKTGRRLATWKEARISPIPKHNSPGQWHPISPISTITKSMEKMVHSRLAWVLAPQHNHLFACCPGVSTHACISTLLSGAQGRKAVAIFIDLEKTFELVSPSPYSLSSPVMVSLVAC